MLARPRARVHDYTVSIACSRRARSQAALSRIDSFVHGNKRGVYQSIKGLTDLAEDQRDTERTFPLPGKGTAKFLIYRIGPKLKRKKRALAPNLSFLLLAPPSRSHHLPHHAARFLVAFEKPVHILHCGPASIRNPSPPSGIQDIYI